MIRRALAVYAAALTVASCLTYRHARLTPVSEAEALAVTSRWAGGALVSRVVTRGPAPAPTDRAEVVEVATGEAALPRFPPLLAFSVRPGLDGVRAVLDGKEAVVTVDDLLSHEAYEHAFLDPGTGLGFGTDPNVVIALLAERLAVSPDDITKRAALTRVGFRRVVSKERERPPPPPLTREVARETLHDFARKLAAGVDGTGRYGYLVDARTGAADGSYNWPRHSGATYFMAQAARLTGDPLVTAACRRAAGLLRDGSLVPCGGQRCIADGDIADLGSSALAILAFTEIDAGGLDHGFRQTIRELTSFIRSQQRPDGEYMHYFDRGTNKPLDIQVLYYTGEATFALARVHRVTGDEDALAAARRSLHHLGRSWTFFGSRYFYGEEHWTCQAAAELVDREPDRSALEFCRGWHAYTRAIQYEPGETPFDAAGGFGVGPLVPPRITAASSRSEAAGALLDALARTSPDDPDVPLLEAELRAALELVLRSRLGRDQEHLFANPTAVIGRLPGSFTDMRLRIDYEQHAGSALVRWLDLDARKK